MKKQKSSFSLGADCSLWKVTVPQDDCVLPEATWQLSVRTLESHGSSGDITLKLGTQSTAAQ